MSQGSDIDGIFSDVEGVGEQKGDQEVGSWRQSSSSSHGGASDNEEAPSVASVCLDTTRSRSRSRSPKLSHRAAKKPQPFASRSPSPVARGGSASTGPIPSAWLRPHPRPPVPGGSEWWVHALMSALEVERTHLPAEPCRPVHHEANCCGTLSERTIAKALGMQLVTVAACEKKLAARKFVVEMHAEDVREQKLGHLYKDFESMIRGGPCVTHPQSRCRRADSVTPDLCTQGLPCQPFSKMRSDDASAEHHKGFSTVFSLFFKYLDEVKPKGFIVEEVEEFASRQDSNGDIFLETFVEECTRRGYEVCVLLMSAGIWSEMERRRLHIVGCSEELGGSRAVQWISDKVDQVIAYRSMQAPTTIKDIVGEVSISDEDNRSCQARIFNWGTRSSTGLPRGRELRMTF